MKKILGSIVALLLASLWAPVFSQSGDPLPSWNEGASKTSIIDFVNRTTKEGSTEFVPVTERIACFDNDGTLWAEQPM